MLKTEKHITLSLEQFQALLLQIGEEIKFWKDFDFHKYLPDAEPEEMSKAVATLGYEPPDSFAEICYMEVLRELYRDQVKRLHDKRDKYQLHIKSYHRAALLQFIYSKDWIEYDAYIYALFNKISEAIR
jgi:hypothetical protein